MRLQMKRHFLICVAAGALVCSWPSQTATAQTTRQITPSNAFAPGEIWPDISGKTINAHGGGMMFHEGTYYWYGEIKEGRTRAPEANRSWGGTRVMALGVSCYSSTNLYGWKFEAIALPATTSEPSHDLHTSKVIERPKVIYNRTTKKFVMWMHIDSEDYAAARSGVAVSEKP